MSQVDPEKYVDAGVALVQLGRMLQRTFPPPNVEGSQYGEFEILRKLLPQSYGSYVDIGAGHWSDCSNSWGFYKLGWRGLLIEPNPDAWQGLLLNRPRDVLCPVAVSNYNGYGTLNLCRSVSSLRPDWRNDNDGTIPTPVETLPTILKRYADLSFTRCDLCSIDAEGSEFQIIDGINWSAFKPTVLILEWAAQDGSDISQEWMPILKANNYVEVHRNKLNLILRKQ